MSHAHTKHMRVSVKGSGEPSETQLAAIRKFTLRDFNADELVVREFALAHNGIDRDNEVMDEALLADFARTIAGKGTYINHPTSWRSDGGPAEGRVFAARVERMSFESAREILREPDLQFPPDRNEAAILFTETFFAKTPENVGLLLKLDAGIVGDVSIGFNAAGPTRIRDAEGRELTAARWTSPGQALEQSLVWLGAQPGARATKETQRNEPENDVDQKEHDRLMGEKQTKLDAEKARADENAKAATSLKAVKDALSETDALLLDDPATLASTIKAARAHTKTLIDDLIKSDRHMKLVGDSDADVAAARKTYEAMPIERLAAFHKHAQARVGESAGKAGGTITGSDPNSPASGTQAAPTDDGTDVTKSAGPFGSPLIG